MQTFGDFLGFNPHCHILVTVGCFYGEKGMSRVAPPLELKKLGSLFRHNVFKMLLAKGKITRELIAMHSSWKHSCFHVFCGNRISPRDDTAMENLARYIIRAILEHLGIWLVKARPPPKIHDPPNRKYAACDLRNEHNDTIYGDPEYLWDDYIQS